MVCKTLQTESLKSLDLDDIKPIFAQPEKDSRQLSIDRKLVRRSDRAVVLDGRRLQNCLEHIGTLPAEGESYHMVSEKRYSMGHIIPAVLTLASPATLDYLGVVTLSFSQANLSDLLALIDAGRVRRVDFGYSVYFRSNNREACQRLAAELTARGHRVYSGLVHAKLLLLAMSDGRAFVVESSANLRSCSSIEQLTLFHDRTLLEFHRQWLDELFQRAKQ